MFKAIILQIPHLHSDIGIGGELGSRRFSGGTTRSWGSWVGSLSHASSGGGGILRGDLENPIQYSLFLSSLSLF